MSAQTNVDAVAERVAGALDVAREQVDAADANVDRRLGPVARPASLARRLRRRGRAGWRAAPGRSRCRGRAFAARSGRARADGRRPDPSAACRARSARRSGRRAGTARSPPSTSARQASAAAAPLMAARPARLGRAARRGAQGAPAASPATRPSGASARQQLRQHGEDDGAAVLGARRVAVVQRAGCRRRARPRARRASTRPGSRRTVSKPRRVQLTSCRSRRCSTGARNGLRSPAGARKKRGASPVMSASVACAAAISRAIARGPSSEKRCEWRSLWFCTLWPRRDDLAAQGRVGARRARRCRRRSPARRARRAGRGPPASPPDRGRRRS